MFAVHTASNKHNATVGITEFIDTALEKGAAIGLLAGTCSIPEEQIMTAALFALGEERTQQLHTFTCSPQQSSQDGEVQHDSYEGLSLEQSMAAARARVMLNPGFRHTSRVCVCGVPSIAMRACSESVFWNYSMYFLSKGCLVFVMRINSLHAILPLQAVQVLLFIWPS